MKRTTLFSLVAVLIFVITTAESCGSAQVATGGATQVQDLGFDIPINAQDHTVEQQNIIDRIAVTTDPTKVLWIHLISLDGTIIRRMPVAHKVTSSGKRLEPSTASSSGVYLPQVPYEKIDGTTGYWYTNELIQPDGTFGSSDPYIFWFDPQHRYHQWGTAGGLGYLLTDYPIDLTNPQDLITGMYNADFAAYEWQKLQEQQMCQNAGKTYDMNTGVCQ